jgi:GNAT superfamily N-acetyltransferase
LAEARARAAVVPQAFQIRKLESLGERELNELGEVLIDCVQGGASVNFLLPMSRAKADRYWRVAAARLERDELVLLAAEQAGRIIGTVQILLGQPENQPHRGDLAKMLVHRHVRRLGVGAALLAAAERAALSAGKTLLVLDTASAEAERLYERHGWQRCGQIPRYALMPDGAPCATVVLYKLLS